MSQYHVPVLLDESVDALNINPHGIYVDLTFGGGGHSKHILSKLSENGILVSFDQDRDAMRNIPQDPRLIFINNNFRYMRSSLRAVGIDQVDGILADLGVSSHHFDDSERGFSFRFDSKLDMRMNRVGGTSAIDIVAEYDHKQLLRIFKDYGELKQPHKIASAIERARAIAPITTTTELVEAVKCVAPKKDESKFLAKLFQAIRIEVNGEIETLHMMLEQSAKVLSKGGRLSVITYHSLEDRAVKNFIRSGRCDGHIEKDLFGNYISPIKAVGKTVLPSDEEIERNSRSRSAKLRIAERV